MGTDNKKPNLAGKGTRFPLARSCARILACLNVAAFIHTDDLIYMIARQLILVTTLLLAGCSSAAPTDTAALRVLFVGNSLTYTNDLPGMVAAFAEASTIAFEYETIAFPNFSLEDHWYQGDARSALSSERWDFVVLQQGPSSLPENQELLRVWTERFAEEGRLHGTEPALYMVWPDASRTSFFPAVIEAYSSAASAVDGFLLPAGAAWLAAWEHNANLNLYGQDDFHPSEMGSYLAALVVFGGLFDVEPTGLPATISLSDGTIIQVPSSTATVLQTAATEALAMYRVAR